MSYSTREQVRDMLGDDALEAIIGGLHTGDKGEREAKIAPIIDAAIEDADGEIDGYLAKRYAVPIAPAPKVINKLSKDVAVYNIYSRIGISEDNREKNILNRYKAAVRFLEQLAEGKVDISAADLSVTSLSNFRVSSAPRLFSRGSLRGM